MTCPNKVLAEIQKNIRETIRVTVSDFKGYQLLAVRIYVENKNGEIVPTKKGLTMRLDTWREILPVLYQVVEVKPAAPDGDTFNQVVQMFNAGLKRTEIAERLKVNRSTVSRHIKKAESEGLLHDLLHGATGTQQHENASLVG